MKEKLNSVEIRGLNREYFHFAVTEIFLDRGLACPSAKEIDAAIQQTSGLLKQVLEVGFRLVDHAKVAAEVGLSVIETRQLYDQALSKVISMLEA